MRFRSISPRGLGRGARTLALVLAGLLAMAAGAAPLGAQGRHASMVIDANTGRVLHEQAADEPRYPASLTKMMTLYLVFEAMEQGRLTPSTRIRISEEAADAAPSKLGIPEGGEIPLMDAVRAIIVKSANDISVAVAEHLAGSEEKFAEAMTRKARQLGMSRTTFRNAHGLPDPGQQTTARDMLTLAMRLADDFPRQFRLFSSRSLAWNGVEHRNHNTMLASYEGMDGIKTGYIRASGFNLVASVRRDGKHVVAVVFGGSSAAARNVYMRAILDRALPRASTERTRERAPRPVLVAREQRERAVTSASSSAPAPQLVEPVRPVGQARRPAATVAEGTPRSAARAREYRTAEAEAPQRPEKRSAASDERTSRVAVPRVRRDAVAAAEPRGAARSEPARPANAAPTPVRLAESTTPPERRIASASMLPGGALPTATARAPTSLQAQAQRIDRGDAPTAQIPTAAPAFPASRPEVPPAQVPTGAAPDLGGRMGAFAAPGLAASARSEVRPQAPSPPEPSPASRTAQAGRGVTIQVGAYASEAEAERRLSAARERAGTRLASARSRAEPVQSGERRLWRARFIGLDQTTAAAACSELKRQQVDCQVVRE